MSTQLTDAPAANWVSFAEDDDGEVYAVALESRCNLQASPGGAGGPQHVPGSPLEDRLRRPDDPKKPAAGVIPYGVNAPLWSDGADKERFLALPDGKTITVADTDGDFDFPNGTVLMKTFTVGGKRIETRLFMRHDDGGWAGYTYEWIDDGSDAVLLPAGKTKTVGTQTWTFPSRSDCVSCHTEAAGRSLGLELGQLNGDFVYPSHEPIANQLKTLDHIGMFDEPLGKPVDQLLAYPDPYGTTAPLEARARAYLHSNCSNCHRPKGGGRGDMDLRFGDGVRRHEVVQRRPRGGRHRRRRRQAHRPGRSGEIDPRAPAALARGEPHAAARVERGRRAGREGARRLDPQHRRLSVAMLEPRHD